jgi:hypothetical protein
MAECALHSAYVGARNFRLPRGPPGKQILLHFFRCRTEFCRIVQDMLVGIFILAAIGGVISWGSSGFQLLSTH